MASISYQFKKKTRIISIIWVFCICLFSQVNAFSLEDKTNSELLESADRVKSSDPEVFFEIIDLLKKREASLVGEEKDFLRYLESYSHSYKGDFTKAIDSYRKIIEDPNVLSDIKVRARISLVNIYGITRDYNNSFTMLQELTQEIGNIKDKRIKDQALVIAAFNYNSYEKYENGKKYAEKLLMGNPDERNLCFGRQLKIESEFYLKKVTFDDKFLNKAIKHCVDIGEPIAAIALHAINARMMLEKGEVTSAINYLLKHEDLVRETEYPNVLSGYYIVFARAKWALNEVEDAELYANKVLDISKGEEYVKPKVFAYSLLHEIAKGKGDFKLALDHYVNYSEADKAQINEILAQQLAYNIIEHQTEEKIQEIKLLNKQNQVLKLEQDLAKQSANNNKLMILLLIFILASLAFWAYRVKRNQIEFKRRSETDALTGVSSRHHFYSACRQTLKDAEQGNVEVSFILFDMDRFKSVNDKYGHLVGDWVLQKAIEVCRPCWRQNDIAGRLGGEEFGLMLPTCDLDKAVEIAEKCRKAIEDVDTIESGHKFHISASFGVTTSKISGYDFSKLIGDSDKIMYQAKAAGKNQVLRVAKKT